MSSLKVIATSTFAVVLWSALFGSAVAQGLSASGAGDVEVAPKDTPDIGGDVVSGNADAERDGGVQADVESKGVGRVDAETNSLGVKP